MDRVQGNQHRPQKPVYHMLQERARTNAENASRPLMNDADVENNTVNQSSSKKWGIWKIAVVVATGIIFAAGIAGVVAGVLWVAGYFDGDTKSVSKDIMHRNMTEPTNGTTPEYTGKTTRETITNYISNRVSEAAMDITDAIYSTTPTTPTPTATTPTTPPTTPTTTLLTSTTPPTDTTSLETTTLDPCSKEGIAREFELIKQRTGPSYNKKGASEYKKFIKECHKQKWG